MSKIVARRTDVYYLRQIPNVVQVIEDAFTGLPGIQKVKIAVRVCNNL